MKPLVLIGDGGHAEVLIDLVRALGVELLGVSSNTKGVLEVGGVKVIGCDREIEKLDPQVVLLVNAVGSVEVGNTRRRIYDNWCSKGFEFATLIHPSAVVSPRARLGLGAQIMAGSVIQTGVSVGQNSILNTRSSIDHHCEIGSHCHVGPGVTISGSVTIGSGSHVGAGATIIQGVSLGNKVLVAAGATVVGSCGDDLRLKGTPARLF